MPFSCPPHILRAYKNGDFTDIVITCGDSTFDVHSLVVGAGCEFFAKSLEFGGKEAEERRIDLPDDDPEMIRRLIAYLYLGDYDPTDDLGIAAFQQLKQYESTTAAASAPHPRKVVFGGSQPHDRCACLALNTKNIEQPASEAEQQNKKLPYTSVRTSDNSTEVVNPLTIHATMYALADKYQAEGLGQLAKTKFQESLQCHVDSEDFIAAVQLAYSNTPESNRGLRDVVVQAFRVHFKVNIKELPGLESKLDTIDELAFLLLKSWPRKTDATGSQKLGSSAITAPTASRAGASASPPTFGMPTSINHANTVSSTPATGNLFGSLPPRTSGGFGSFSSTPRNTGNTQTGQTPGVFGS